MKILFFDIDGTLLLTGGAGKVAIERAFEETFGVPDCWSNISPDGKTDPAIFDEIALQSLGRPLAPAEYAALKKRYLDHFERLIDDSPRFRLMPGVPELVSKLASRSDVLLGIVTGNFERSARLKLKKAGLEAFFGFGGYACDSHDRTLIVQAALERLEARLSMKRDLCRLFMVGDTDRDIRCARDHRITSIAVATGSYSVDELKSHGADFALPDLADHNRFFGIIDRPEKPSKAL